MHVVVTANFTASDVDHVAGIGCSHVHDQVMDHLSKSTIVAMTIVARVECDDHVLEMSVLQAIQLRGLGKLHVASAARL